MSRYPVSFAERNRVVIAIVGLITMGVVFYGVLNMSSLPIVGAGKTYSAVFTEAGGLRPGDEVRVAGVRVGEVTDVQLDGKQVVVSFQAKGVHLKDATTAAIKVKTMLGQKFVSLDPLGSGSLHGRSRWTGPRRRTTSTQRFRTCRPLSTRSTPIRWRPASRRLQWPSRTLRSRCEGWSAG